MQETSTAWRSHHAICADCISVCSPPVILQTYTRISCLVHVDWVTQGQASTAQTAVYTPPYLILYEYMVVNGFIAQDVSRRASLRALGYRIESNKANYDPILHLLCNMSGMHLHISFRGSTCLLKYPINSNHVHLLNEFAYFTSKQRASLPNLCY